MSEATQAVARAAKLREWAAWNDQALDEHGTEVGVDARKRANAIMDDLGDLSDADWGVIRNAQREYVRQSA